MRFVLSLLILTACLAGCGSEPVYIVEKLNLRLHFKDRAAEVEFQFSPDYETQFQVDEVYEGLAFAQLKKQERQSLYIYSIIDPDHLKLPWPLSKLDRLPSGHSLPSPVGSSWIYEWKKENLSLLVQDKGDLLIGSSFQHVEFDKLPEDFLGVQYIRAKDGSLRASIAAFGPGAGQRGGLLLFANFGQNPFEIFEEPETKVWEFVATESFQVLSWGKWYKSKYFLKSL